MLAATFLLPDRALAVRPFVTDDARVADLGQVEGETWLELSRPGGRVLPVYNVLLNVEVLNWLEVSLAGGVGWDVDDRLTLPNPGVQSKILFVRPESDRYPGVAFAAGALFPLGRGSASSDVTAFYAVAPLTLALFDDDLQVHANLGWLFARLPGGSVEHRPFWGVGADVALFRSDFHAVAETFAGDPSDPLGPKIAFQVGARWLPSDYINVDLAVGAAPKIGPATGLDPSVQIGLRFLIDAFTPGGRPGNPDGAPGLFRDL